MALTANQILSDIRNIATSGSNPIDFRIDDSQILFWIDSFRSTLISQALQKRQDISDVWVQSISCLDLIEVDKSECCEIETNCKILRTQSTLPQTIETTGDNTIIRILKPNGDPIHKLNQSEAKYTQYTKYGSKGAKWYSKNGYIYIIDDDMLEQITVYGIFDTPSDLSNYASCDGSACYDVNQSYPCSKKMAEQITDMVLKKKVYPFLQLPQDNTNDASNNTIQPNTRNL